MLNKLEISQIFRDAYKIRHSLNIKQSVPINIYDVVNKYDDKINIIFVEANSFEGLYCKNPGPNIILNINRPTGRKNFNCAHEFAHHFYGHQTTLDLIINNYASVKEERITNLFAGFLLLPKMLIDRAINLREWKPKDLTPIQIYILSRYFGVGYSTLVKHLSYTLKIITNIHCESLLKSRPIKLREELFEAPCNTNLYIIDSFWENELIDIEINDYLSTEKEILVEGTSILKIKENNNSNFYIANQLGISKLINPVTKWSSFVRVSRNKYIGDYQYKFLEDSNA
ncbi:MAG: ImmA/IrrE family metallo-endopeptidase [Bacteroidetes bacterium]|nr:ImmA/IrrE family metallo-endopeptidase [Bacteroidota bacterium]